MLNKFVSMGFLTLAIGFALIACDDQPNFVSGFNQGNGNLVDGNGLPINGATVYIPSAGDPLALQGTTSPLAATGTGGTCDDPLEAFTSVDCTGTNGFFSLPCPASNVRVQVNGEVVHEFSHSCSAGQENTVEVPDVFEEPLGFVPLTGGGLLVGPPTASSVAVFNSVSDEMQELITGFTISDGKKDYEPTLFDVDTAPNGDAVVTGISNFFTLLGAFSGDFPVTLDVEEENAGNIYVIDSETSAITTIPTGEFLPFNVSVHPNGSKAYVTGIPFLDFLPGDPGIVIPAAVGIVDLDNQVFVGYMIMPPPSAIFPGDETLAISTHVAFTQDGAEAIVTTAVISVCDQCLGPLGSFSGEAYFIDAVSNTVLPYVINEFPGEQSLPLFLPPLGEIAISNGKAYLAFTKILGLMGSKGNLDLGDSDCNELFVVDMTEKELIDAIFMGEDLALGGGDLCPVSVIASPTANEIYVGALPDVVLPKPPLGPGYTAFIEIDSSTDEINDGILFDGKGGPSDVLPIALGVNPEGDKVYIASEFSELGVEECDPLSFLIYATASDELTGSVDVLEENCEAQFPLNFSVQGM